MPVQRSIVAWFGGIFVEFADSISTYLNFLIESNRLFDCCCCFLRFFNSISIEGGNTILVHIQLTNHILTEMLWGHNNTRIIRLNDSFTKAKQLIFQWFVITTAIIVIGMSMVIVTLYLLLSLSKPYQSQLIRTRLFVTYKTTSFKSQLSTKGNFLNGFQMTRI